MTEEEPKDIIQEEEQSDNENKKTSGSGRYIFECQKCGECCKKKEVVVVSFDDLRRWNEDMTLPSLYQFLSIEIKDNDYVHLSLKKPESPEGETVNGCPLYDENNKICNIYFSMPLLCTSFPLGFDGNGYFIKDKTCQGLGKGTMNEESLKGARSLAKDDFDARVTTSILLPVINGLALKFMMEQSKKQIESLTQEQKEKLKDILGEDAGDPKVD